METLHPRISTYNSNPIWSQELDLLSWSQETKSMTSTMFFISFWNLMLNWYILQGTRWFNQTHYLNDQTFSQMMTQTMKTWLCFQITCFSTSLTWIYNKELWWQMILMAVQPKHWNSFRKQHPHQWQKDWRIGKLKCQMDKTFFSSKERTIYQEIWTYDEK